MREVKSRSRRLGNPAGRSPDTQARDNILWYGEERYLPSIPTGAAEETHPGPSHCFGACAARTTGYALCAPDGVQNVANKLFLYG